MYQSEFINCSITFISLGYSGNISNYSLMGLSDKTNNLVIYCLVAWWAQSSQPNPFILPPISVIFFEGQIAFQEKWVNRCPLLEIANNVTVFFLLLACEGVCLVERRRLIIILFAYWEVASIIFLGLHDKLQIAKVIYAMRNLFRVCFFASVYQCTCWLVSARAETDRPLFFSSCCWAITETSVR